MIAVKARQHNNTTNLLVTFPSQRLLNGQTTIRLPISHASRVSRVKRSWKRRQSKLYLQTIVDPNDAVRGSTPHGSTVEPLSPTGAAAMWNTASKAMLCCILLYPLHLETLSACRPATQTAIAAFVGARQLKWWLLLSTVGPLPGQVPVPVSGNVHNATNNPKSQSRPAEDGWWRSSDIIITILSVPTYCT